MERYDEIEIRAFVGSVFLAATEGREPMSQEEAWYTIQQWRDEGIEIPAGLDAWELSHIWNAMIEG